MPCIKALLLSTLQLAASFLPSHNNFPHDNHSRFQHVDVTITGDFQENLNSLPEASIHAALQESLPNFKDGMFEHDSSAIEAVHRTNPPLATKLLAAARYDLLRRQNGNLTTVNPPVTTSAGPTINSNGLVEITSTNAQGSTVVATVTPSAGLISSVVLLTTTLADGTRSTYTSFAMIPVASSTNGPRLQGAGEVVRPVSIAGLLVAMVAFGALLL